MRPKARTARTKSTRITSSRRGHCQTEWSTAWWPKEGRHRPQQRCHRPWPHQVTGSSRDGRWRCGCGSGAIGQTPTRPGHLSLCQVDGAVVSIRIWPHQVQDVYICSFPQYKKEFPLNAILLELKRTGLSSRHSGDLPLAPCRHSPVATHLLSPVASRLLSLPTRLLSPLTTSLVICL